MIVTGLAYEYITTRDKKGQYGGLRYRFGSCSSLRYGSL